MRAILSVAQMRALEHQARRTRGEDALIARAGTRVAAHARDMLGRVYGSRVLVIAGPGHNGDDGRVAAAVLERNGAVVDVVGLFDPHRSRPYDLIIDAGLGVGLSRDVPLLALDPQIPVLAVDVPTGIDADTGAVRGHAVRATRTVALGALKWAHVMPDARPYLGDVVLEDLDLTPDESVAMRMDGSDLARLRRRGPHDHKWHHAVHLAAGSKRMPGAAALVSAGAVSAGASMVRLATRASGSQLLDLPDEVVRTKKGVDERCRATVVGPGVGTSVKALAWMLDQVRVGTPTVLDADALRPEMLARAPRNFTWVVTPHEGEFARLFQPCGSGVSRVATAKWAARQHGVVVLLKGPLTVITDGERVHLVDAGSPTLATAGSGDVLSGVIGALLARGHDAMTAASLGALVHAEASHLLYEGEPASALAPAICEVLGEWHRAS